MHENLFSPKKLELNNKLIEECCKNDILDECNYHPLILS